MCSLDERDDPHSALALAGPVPVPWVCPPQGGRPPKHGGEFVFGRPETWGPPRRGTEYTPG